MLMTKCAACATVFQVSLADLAPSNGRVRCGNCNHIFDAQENLISLANGHSQSSPEHSQIPLPPVSQQSHVPHSIIKPAILDASLPRYQKQRNTPIEIEENLDNSTFTKRRVSKLVGFDPKFQASTTPAPLPDQPRAFASAINSQFDLQLPPISRSKLMHEGAPRSTAANLAQLDLELPPLSRSSQLPNRAASESLTPSQLDISLPPLPQSNIYRPPLSRPGAGREKKPLRSFTPVRIPEDAFKRDAKVAHSIFPSSAEANNQPYERHPSQVANAQLPANALHDLVTRRQNRDSQYQDNVENTNAAQFSQRTPDSAKQLEHPGFKLSNDLNVPPLAQLEQEILRANNNQPANRAYMSSRIDPLQAPPKVRNTMLTGESSQKTNNINPASQFAPPMSQFTPSAGQFPTANNQSAAPAANNQLQQEILNQALQSQLMQYLVASLNPQANLPFPALPPTIIRQLLAQHEAFNRFQRVTSNNLGNSLAADPVNLNNILPLDKNLLSKNNQTTVAQQIYPASPSLINTTNITLTTSLPPGTIATSSNNANAHTASLEHPANNSDKNKKLPDFPFANVPTTSALIDQSSKRRKISTAIPADDHKHNFSETNQTNSFLQPYDNLNLPRTTANANVFFEPAADLTLSSYLSEVDDEPVSEASVQELSPADFTSNKTAKTSNMIHPESEIIKVIPDSKIVAASGKNSNLTRIPSFLDEELHSSNNVAATAGRSSLEEQNVEAHIAEELTSTSTREKVTKQNSLSPPTANQTVGKNIPPATSSAKPILTTTISPLITASSTAPAKSIQGRIKGKTKNSATIRMGEEQYGDKSLSFLQDEDINLNVETVVNLTQKKENFSNFNASEIARETETDALNDSEFSREIPEPKPLPTRLQAPQAMHEEIAEPLYARPSEWETIAEPTTLNSSITADQDDIQRQRIEGALEEIRYGNVRSITFLQVFSALCLAAVLVLQIGYFYREQIVEWQPKVDRIYQKLGLPALLLSNRELIAIENSELNADANTKHLIFRARIKNLAKFRQAWPLLELSFLDEVGNPISRRVLKPDSYLPKSEKNSNFAANKTIEVSLLFDGSQIRPTGFLLTAFYP